MQYYGARYLDNQIAKFISVDSVDLNLHDPEKLKELMNGSKDKVLSDPQLLNSYAYTSNNPLKYTDPDGNFLDTILDIGFIGYDLYKITSNAIKGESVKSELGNLGLDVGGALLPGVTGLGMMARTAKVVDNAGDVAKTNKVLKNIDNVDKSINWTKQSKHILGESYKEGKSILTYSDPQKLINDFAGKGQKYFNESGLWKEVVDFGEKIGKYLDNGTNKLLDTTRGTIHYGKDGVHIVPAKPTNLLKR